MSLYRVWCKFEPDHINAPAGRKGQWRVFHCRLIPEQEMINFESGHRKIVVGGPVFLALNSTKPYPKGSIIRPHRELNRVLAAKKGNL